MYEMNNLIQSYHNTHKDDYHLFLPRATALQKIANVAQQYLNTLGVQANLNKFGPTKGLSTNPAEKFKYPFETWVNSLAKRAQKKADYLTVLSAWYNNPKKAKPKYTDAQQLWDLLWAKAQGNVKGDNQEFLSTTAYAKMEKIDPFHRNIVFLSGQDGSDIQPYHHNAMAIAFQEYMFTALGVWPVSTPTYNL
jgi:hypothetical protein